MRKPEKNQISVQRVNVLKKGNLELYTFGGAIIIKLKNKILKFKCFVKKYRSHLRVKIRLRHLVYPIVYGDYGLEEIIKKKR